MEATLWEISGSYLEACNCEAICPCRRIGGRPGGRSTYGECLGALSWIVKEGRAGDTDLADMRTVLAMRYHDDEPGSPWTFALFVDARGDERQRQALADIFTGRLGGTPLKQFPWVFKPATLLGVEALDIEIDHTPGRGWFRAPGKVEVRVRGPVPDQEAVDFRPPPPRARTLERRDRHRHQPAGVLGPRTLRLRDDVRVLSRRSVASPFRFAGRDSPRGLVLAPASLGAFAGDLLVGNLDFGDGAIDAYDPTTGVEKGQMTNTDGTPDEGRTGRCSAGVCR